MRVTGGTSDTSPICFHAAADVFLRILFPDEISLFAQKRSGTRVTRPSNDVRRVASRSHDSLSFFRLLLRKNQINRAIEMLAVAVYIQPLFIWRAENGVEPPFVVRLLIDQ